MNMKQCCELQARLAVFDCTVYTFDMLLQQTGRTLHDIKSKAHSERTQEVPVTYQPTLHQKQNLPPSTDKKKPVTT
jgi:hypothetical protein